METKNIRIEEYCYDLPEYKIAKHPLEERDRSGLLVYKNHSLLDSEFRQLASHLPHDALLFVNNTKVIEARLHFTKPSGARIEIFCLEPSSEYKNVSEAMHAKGSVKWKCLIGGASKWKVGQILEQLLVIDGKEVILSARFLNKEQQSFLISLQWTNESFTFAQILNAAGTIPLPPYIKRETELSDTIRYQTVYANEPGSVAAPTAGLHFTPEVFEELRKKRIKTENLTLHVGAGTFKPVKSQFVGDHEMHAERIDVSISTLKTLLNDKDRIVVAVGTTSLRTLESLYWFGIITIRNPLIKPEYLSLQQWYPYENDSDLTITEALQSLTSWMERNNLERLISRTSILIAPGYKMRVVNILVTNFHQPQSTLLLLIAAFIGDDWRMLYEHALTNDYRFLSYGDACLLIRQ